MKALLKDGSTLGIRSLSPPRHGPREVLLRVVVAGLCRTDLYVAQGLLGRSRLILGHEFSALVEAVGPEVEGLRPGQRVAVFPWTACGHCATCREGWPGACPQRAMLGVDRDGAFAELVAVPAELVHPMPDSMSFLAGAYVEPVAAALAVLRAGLDRRQRGLVYGANRIAALIYKILRLHGFDQVELSEDPQEPNAYDFVVESQATPRAMAAILRCIRPGGKVVLRSRQPQGVPLDLLTAVPKELTFRCVNYASFQESLELLRENRLELSDLLGPVHPLEEFQELFEEASRQESSKRFLALTDASVWDS